MPKPPYLKQNNPSTCSLAVLRMVLAAHELEVSEEELLDKVKPDYGEDFSNIWNATIAKLACQYGVKTSLYALWPLLKPDTLIRATAEFKSSPEQFDVYKYENPDDKDDLPEPLLLAYKEVFNAVDSGCSVHYGSLTKPRLKSLINEGQLIQSTVKVNQLYSDAPIGFHSILIYDYNDNLVKYHDPFVGPDLSVSIDKLIEVATDVGAFMTYAH